MATFTATPVDLGHQEPLLSDPGQAGSAVPIIDTTYPRTAHVDYQTMGSGAWGDLVVPLRDDTSWTGWLIDGIEHWYTINEKILIKPARYDLGLITDDVWRTGLIWNNRSLSATLETIALPSDQGIVLWDLAVSDVIAARQDHVHTFQIVREGPATIDALIVFGYAANDVSQTITGYRGVVWPMRPRDDGYAEGREWHTSIFRSDSGVERRETLTNATPPRTIRFPVRFHRFEERAVAENLLRFGAEHTFLVPLWFSVSQLTAATNGTSLLQAPTAEREFAVDGFVALIRRARENPHAIVRQIAALTGSTIHLTDIVEADRFGVGDWCIPAVLCSFPEGANLSDLTTSFGEFVATFEEL